MADDKQESNWGTEGGGPGQWDFDLDVKDGRFEMSQFDSIQFIPSGFNHEVPHKGDDFPMFLGVGKTGFEIVDGGKGIDPLPGTRKVRASSKYGIFLDSVIQAADGKLLEGRDPFRADVFNGLTLSIHQDEETYTIEGKTTVGRVYTVTGVRETQPEKKGRAKAEAKAAVVDPLAIPSGETVATLKAIARDKGTYEEYVDEAYEVLGADLLNKPWEDEATSQAYYDTLKAG